MATPRISIALVSVALVSGLCGCATLPGLPPPPEEPSVIVDDPTPLCLKAKPTVAPEPAWLANAWSLLPPAVFA
jgi:hypothetical protein